jgi:outer membrane lipoprotein-sorting protein
MKKLIFVFSLFALFFVVGCTKIDDEIEKVNKEYNARIYELMIEFDKELDYQSSSGRITQVFHYKEGTLPGNQTEGNQTEGTLADNKTESTFAGNQLGDLTSVVE